MVMTEFKVNNKISIRCITYSTRYSWGHKGTLTLDGEDVLNTKVTYQNRTWESYQFQSLLYHVAYRAHKLKLLTKEESDEIVEFAKSGDRGVRGY